jgi:hypothetical protein
MRRLTPQSSRVHATWLLVSAFIAALGLVACSSLILPPPASISASASPNAAGPARPAPTASQGQPSDTQPGQSRDTGAAAIEDACALITPAEVSAIVGGPELVPKPLPAGGWVAAQCAWSGPTSSFLVSIGTIDSLEAFNDPATPDAKTKFADYKQKFAAGSAAEVDGLGDGAVVGATGLAAYTGGTYLEILRSSLTDDQLVAVAKQILSNL